MPSALPAIRYQPSRPQLVDSVSASRVGERAIAFVEFADPFWRLQMSTAPLRAADLALVEAFRDETRTAMRTVRHSPEYMLLPQAYWGDPDAAALADTGVLTGFTGRFTFTFNSVTNGLTLMRGDAIGLETGDYRSLHRIQAGGVASGNALTVTVEPFVPGYIETGALVRFKAPELNWRVLPGSFAIPDTSMPVASFTLVEVPK
jgi:hypothetical protein